MRALFLVALAGFSAGQAQEFHVRSWHVEEGLPDATITAVAQTPDGYLWVGTPRGLVRFDGATFRTFGVGPATGLTETHIAALLVDRSGLLWVAGAGGSLACSEAGRFRTVSSAEEGSGATPAGFALSFIAMSNRTYSVQVRPALAAGAWTNLISVAAAPTNRLLWITNAPVMDANRFYRVAIP